MNENDDTGRVSRDDIARARDLIALYAELDATNARRDDLAHAILHLGGEIKGHDVDLAKLGDQGNRVEGKLDQVLAAVATISTAILETNQRVVSLEDWRRRHDLAAASAELGQVAL